MVPADRAELFSRASVECFPANLNPLDPWPQLPDNSFGAVLFGEVIEHIPNHPLGVLKAIHRVLRRGGLLILTTPNPQTLANSLRLAWGIQEFMLQPKISPDGVIIDCGEIHYREYSQKELPTLLEKAGFRAQSAPFITSGSAEGEGIAKRLLKSIPAIRRQRLFGSGHYVTAIKPQRWTLPSSRRNSPPLIGVDARLDTRLVDRL